MADTSFMDDVVFPIHVSRGTLGGPDWPAEIVELASGHEERNTPISKPLRRYDVKYGVRTPAELHEILSLYYVALGRMRGFRLMDWTDYKSCHPGGQPAATDQPLGEGDGTKTEFQLVKRYSFLSYNFDREIRKPFGTLLVAVDGTPAPSGWSLDAASGIVTFDVAPADSAELTWGGTFHVPVRFDCRLDQVSLRTAVIGDIPSIFLKELRL